MLDLLGLLSMAIDGVLALGGLLPRPGEAKNARARRLALGKQRRWLRQWARADPPRTPIPERGFVCEYCDYPLAGLTRPLCPECGRRVVA